MQVHVQDMKMCVCLHVTAFSS